MQPEYDFSNAERGKFFKDNAKLNLPVYLDDEVQIYFQLQMEEKPGSI